MPAGARSHPLSTHIMQQSRQLVRVDASRRHSSAVFLTHGRNTGRVPARGRDRRTESAGLGFEYLIMDAGFVCIAFSAILVAALIAPSAALGYSPDTLDDGDNTYPGGHPIDSESLDSPRRPWKIRTA